MIVRDRRELAEELRKFICGCKYVVACVGTELRCDDRVGLVIYEMLKEVSDRVVRCEYGLENCLDVIEELNPEKLIIIDAALGNASPGAVILSGVEDVVEWELLTTHNIPLRTVLKYLRASSSVRDVLIIGIRVKNLDFGDVLSEEVAKAAEFVAEVLKEVITECGKAPLS